jgi:UDP-N-acetylmuramoyl-L-alanyl-D-glutamate--2,6-diaminopimelate ligase
MADGLGLPREPTLAALATATPVPGRFETVEVDAPFDLVVDLGVNPVGVAAALEAVRPVAAARGGRLLTVLSGIGGSAIEHGTPNGAAARELSDHLILAGSSYRGEPRVQILATLVAGARATTGAELEVVIDRRRAIARAISLARPGDVVVLLGRGHIPREATDERGSFAHLHDATAAREIVEALAGTSR